MTAITRSWLAHGVHCILLLHWTEPCSAQRPGAATPLSPGQTVMHQHISVDRGRRTCEARRYPQLHSSARRQPVQAPSAARRCSQCRAGPQVHPGGPAGAAELRGPGLLRRLGALQPRPNQAPRERTSGSPPANPRPGAGACRSQPALAVHHLGGGPPEGALTQVGDPRPTRPGAAWRPGEHAAGPEAVAEGCSCHLRSLLDTERLAFRASRSQQVRPSQPPQGSSLIGPGR